MHNLAMLMEAQGKLNGAEALHRQVLEVREVRLGTEHSDTITSVASLAKVLAARGKLDKAEVLYVREQAWNEATLGRSDGRTQACEKSLALIREALAKQARVGEAAGQSRAST